MGQAQSRDVAHRNHYQFRLPSRKTVEGAGAFAAALALSAAAALLLAQESGKPSAAAQERPVATTPDSGGADASPKDKGSTGWTGGTRDQEKRGVGSRALTGNDAQDLAADQPEMATGVDLKGPPHRFAPAQTPE